jgi:hypothetical protein
MRQSSGIIFFSFFFYALGISAARAQNWVDGQSASFVIGQWGFDKNYSGYDASGLEHPDGVVVDPTTGKVFVSDMFNHRVLRYPSITAMMNDGWAEAEAVLGQPSLMIIGSSSGTAAGARDIYSPDGLAISAAGSLYVVDQKHSRVVRFDHAATIASGASANGVLGQPGFGFRFPVWQTSQSGMFNPISIFCSGTTLFVSDGGNNRILRFDNADSKPDGANADAVLGQSDFDTFRVGDGDTGLNGPTQIYVDGSDNLWVADCGHNRVLMFPNATTFTNGEAATLVLGQKNFTSHFYGAPTSSTFKAPFGVYGDTEGNIYVADNNNNRILIFNHAASLANGSAASYVLGQDNFTSAGVGTGAAQLDRPEALFVGQTLLVAEYENNRVMVYTPLVPLPPAVTAFTAKHSAASAGGAGATSAAEAGGARPGGLTLYPNPAQHTITLKLPQDGGAAIQVYNSTGHLAFREEVTGNAVHTLHISRLAAGVYTVRVMQDGHAMTSNFIKVK